MATTNLFSINSIGKAAAIAIFVSGCASHPDRIKPAAYSGKPCTAADRTRLVELTAEQKRAANTDALGVFLIGLPIGSMNGPDHKSEIATGKEQRYSISRFVSPYPITGGNERNEESEERHSTASCKAGFIPT
jgi:hypothetical protein